MHSMCNLIQFPDQGSSGYLQWKHGFFLTIGLPGKSLIIIIIFTMLILLRLTYSSGSMESPAVELWSLFNHWTARKVPNYYFYYAYFAQSPAVEAWSLLTTGLPGKSVIIIIIIFTVLILLRLTYCMYYFDSLDSSLTQLVNVEYQDQKTCTILLQLH